MATFSILPPEIRREIWGHCLPEDKPEIYFCRKRHAISNFRQDGDVIPKIEVAIGLPSIMHLCHESRVFALESLSFRETTVQRPGSSTPAKVKTPCREFRPDLDVLHLAAHNCVLCLVALHIDRDVLRGATGWTRVEHIAIPAMACDKSQWGFFQERLLSLAGLRTISVVFHKAAHGETVNGRKARSNGCYSLVDFAREDTVYDYEGDYDSDDDGPIHMALDYDFLPGLNNLDGDEDMADVHGGEVNIDQAEGTADVEDFGTDVEDSGTDVHHTYFVDPNNVVEDLQMRLAVMEVDLEGDSPWDPETGECLINIVAREMVRQPKYV